jgi:hypothetical protein
MVTAACYRDTVTLKGVHSSVVSCVLGSQQGVLHRTSVHGSVQMWTSVLQRFLIEAHVACSAVTCETPVASFGLLIGWTDSVHASLLSVLFHSVPLCHGIYTCFTLTFGQFIVSFVPFSTSVPWHLHLFYSHIWPVHCQFDCVQYLCAMAPTPVLPSQLASSIRDWWQTQSKFDVILYLSSALIALQLSDGIQIFIFLQPFHMLLCMPSVWTTIVYCASLNMFLVL